MRVRFPLLQPREASVYAGLRTAWVFDQASSKNVFTMTQRIKIVLDNPSGFGNVVGVMTITPPTIHLNGTSAKDLWAGYEAAYDAVRAAQEALGKIEFNARDYYVQSPGAWEKAQDHRIKQRQALAQVEEYLLQHLLAIREQSDL